MSNETQPNAQPQTTLWVGSYTRRGGKGLYPATWRAAPESLEVGPVRPLARNVSAAVAHPALPLIYLAEENEPGCVAVCRLADSGLTRIAEVATGGEAPCHLGLDGEGRRLAAANYKSGSVGLIALEPDGSPSGPAKVVQLSGSGPNAERQEGPHAHWVGLLPELGGFHVADLGADTVSVIEDPAGEPAQRVVWRAPPGSGPRQLLGHPRLPLAYLVSELASTLTVLEPGGAGLRARATVSTLPAGFDGESLGGHIVMNAAGDRLFVSNRGHDSIAVFSVDEGGEVELLQHVGSGGASPRFMLLDEALGRLFVAHEESGTLTVLPFDPDGVLHPPTANAEIPGAVCVFRAG